MAYRRKSGASRGSYSRKRSSRSGPARRRTVSRTRRGSSRSVKRRAAPRSQTIKVVIETTSANPISRPDTLVPMAEPRKPRKAKF